MINTSTLKNTTNQRIFSPPSDFFQTYISLNDYMKSESLNPNNENWDETKNSIDTFQKKSEEAKLMKANLRKINEELRVAARGFYSDYKIKISYLKAIGTQNPQYKNMEKEFQLKRFQRNKISVANQKETTTESNNT